MEKAEGKLVRIGALELHFMVDEIESAGSIVMFELVVPSDARVPAPHYHRDVDEVVHALAGTLAFTLDGETRELRPGDTVFVPRGSIHGFENLHPDTARTLTVLTPGSIGRRYFEEIGAEVNGPGKPDLGRVKDIMLRHGLVPA